MPKTIYDHRERRSGVIKELIKRDIDVIEKDLKTADYIIQTKDLNNKILNLGIERKSVVGNTSVVIKQKEEIRILPIKEAYAIFKKNKDMEVTGLDLKNKKIGWFNVYDVTKHKSNDIYRISTSPKIKKKYDKEENSVVKLTGGHNVYVFRNRKIIIIPTSELKRGDYMILIPPKLKEINPKPYKSFKEFLKYVQSDSIKNFKLYKKEFKLGSGLHNQKIPEFNKDFFFLLGLWVAEGRYDNLQLTINQKDKLRNKIIERYLKRVFKWYNKTSDAYGMGGKVYYKLFKDILKLKNGAGNKTIPSIVFSAPNKLKAEFIKGYLFGDGYRNLNKNRKNPQLMAVSKSKLLIVGLSYLLFSLGVENSTHQEYKSYNNKRRKYYLLRIKTISLKDFIKKIGQVPTKEIKIQKSVSTKIPYYLKITIRQSLPKLNKKDLKFLYEDLIYLKKGKTKSEKELFKITNKIHLKGKSICRI